MSQTISTAARSSANHRVRAQGIRNQTGSLAPPSAWKGGGKSFQGLVWLPRRKSSSRRLMAHQKPRNAGENPGSFCGFRAGLEPPSPVSARNRPIQFWLAGKPDQHGNCRFFPSAIVAFVLRNVNARYFEMTINQLFQLMGKLKVTAVDRPCGTYFRRPASAKAGAFLVAATANRQVWQADGLPGSEWDRI